MIYREEYRLYNFGPDHPFSPVRLEMLTSLLQALGVWRAPLAPLEARREEVLSVHSERLVKRVEAASRGELYPDLEHYGLGTGDTPVFPGMDRAARILVGGTLEGARRIMAGEKRVLQLGGGLHHAQYDRASGFCVYNDLSVAIRHMTQVGLRVAYVDIDVHHGDGVQWIHYEEGEVLTLSLHESGRYLFPGTGHVYEIGRGAGLGKKLNLPLEPFTEDESYLGSLRPWCPGPLRPSAPTSSWSRRGRTPTTWTPWPTSSSPPGPTRGFSASSWSTPRPTPGKGPLHLGGRVQPGRDGEGLGPPLPPLPRPSPARAPSRGVA